MVKTVLILFGKAKIIYGLSVPTYFAENLKSDIKNLSVCLEVS